MPRAPLQKPKGGCVPGLKGTCQHLPSRAQGRRNSQAGDWCQYLPWGRWGQKLPVPTERPCSLPHFPACFGVQWGIRVSSMWVALACVTSRVRYQPMYLLYLSFPLFQWPCRSRGPCSGATRQKNPGLWDTHWENHVGEPTYLGLWMRKKPLFYEVKPLRFQGLFVGAVNVNYLNPSTEVGR